MKNIFVCHRPYHILRSANMVFLEFNRPEVENILISYNLININTQSFQANDVFPSIEKYFSKIIRQSRNDDVSIWNFFQFNKYYKAKIAETELWAKELIDFDNLFFFSDLEKPIEILVGLLKENRKRGAEILLVDEGLASYYRTRPLWKDVVKYLVVKCGGYKYLNHYASYGQSSLYTSALATYPEKCVFKKVPLHKMNPLNAQLLDEVVRSEKVNINLNLKYILYISNILDLSYGITREREIEVLKEIKILSERNGFLFYIKPHPVQEVSYYTDSEDLADSVITTKLPAEVFFTNNGIIVSVGSSSLINAQVQGVKAINISLLFGIHLKQTIFSLFSPQDITQYEQYIKEK